MVMSAKARVPRLRYWELATDNWFFISPLPHVPSLRISSTGAVAGFNSFSGIEERGREATPGFRPQTKEMVGVEKFAPPFLRIGVVDGPGPAAFSGSAGLIPAPPVRVGYFD